MNTRNLDEVSPIITSLKAQIERLTEEGRWGLQALENIFKTLDWIAQTHRDLLTTYVDRAGQIVLLLDFIEEKPVRPTAKEKDMNFKEVQLATIADGKAIAQFNFELGKAIENCLDLATEAGAVREVKLTVKIKPNQDRSRAEITFQAISKCAPDSAGTDQVFFSSKGAFVSSARQLTLDEQHHENVADIETAQSEGGDQ
jgi:hypothetical protein